MEIKEVKRNNHNWIKELIIILLGILILTAVSLRTDAAPQTNYIYRTFTEYHENGIGNGLTSTGEYSLSYSSDNMDKIKTFAYHVNGEDSYAVFLYSDEQYTIILNDYECSYKLDGSLNKVWKDDTFTLTGNPYTLPNGRTIYVYGTSWTVWQGRSNSNNKTNTVFYTDVYNVTREENNGFSVFDDILASGLEPEIKYEIPIDEIDMTLTGFECNEYMEAFWTGISGLSGYASGELVVEVKPSYVLMLEEGEELQPFEKPDVINVPFENMSFSNTYDYYFENNPYKGRAILTLNFTPVFSPVQTNPVVLRGKTIKVTFDKNGEFGGYDIPVDGLVPEYSDIEFVLNNFNALSEVNQGEHIINCMWNGSSIDGLIDYVYSEIKVEIYCMDKEDGSWKWLEYPLDKIISIKTNRLDLKLNSLAEYALSNNMIFKDVQNGSSMFKDSMIRITPFYKGYSDYVYGKSVVITTTYSGGIKVIQQSNGDGFVENPMYQELGKDYFDDHSPVGDYMDSILDGFDESEMNLDKVTLNFFTLLKGLLSATGQFPALFAAVFSFLPDYFISMIVVSLSLVIILRVIGR